MQAPIFHGLLMAFMFLSGLGLTKKSNDGNLVLGSIFAFIYSSIFVGFAIGRALAKSRQTYIWSTNLLFKKLHNTVLMALPLSLSIIFLVFVLVAGSGNGIFVILGLTIQYTMILAHDFQKSSVKMFLMYIPFIILLQSKGKGVSILNDSFGLLILFGYYGIILLESILKFRTDKGYRKVYNKNQSKVTLLIQQIKILQPNYLSRDVGLSFSNNGLTFPVNGLFMAFPVVIYSVVKNVIFGEMLKTVMVMTFMFLLNILVIFRFKWQMKQVENYAHVFIGKNHFGIKSRLVKFMDKDILLNNLVFILIILMTFFSFDMQINRINLILSLFLSLIFFFNTYTIAMAVKVNSRAEFALIVSIIYAVFFLILQALIDKYQTSFLNWTVNLSILGFALLVRYFSEKRFMKAKFETLIK